jgi:hypothetical protein
VGELLDINQGAGKLSSAPPHPTASLATAYILFTAGFVLMKSGVYAVTASQGTASENDV